MKNYLNIFSLKIFNSGSTIFDIDIFYEKSICLLQIFDSHNHPFFNIKTTKLGLVNERLNKYQNKLFTNK